MYTFGQPRVGNEAFAAAFAAAVSEFRLVHYADIVPHFPPQFLGYSHPPTEVRRLPVLFAPTPSISVRGRIHGGCYRRVDQSLSVHVRWCVYTMRCMQVWYNENNTAFTVCSATNGEDPNCSDSLPLPISTRDHDTYLNVDMDVVC